MEGPVKGGGPSRGKLIPRSRGTFSSITPMLRARRPGKGEEEAASGPDIWSQCPPLPDSLSPFFSSPFTSPEPTLTFSGTQVYSLPPLTRPSIPVPPRTPSPLLPEERHSLSTWEMKIDQEQPQRSPAPHHAALHLALHIPQPLDIQLFILSVGRGTSETG